MITEAIVVTIASVITELILVKKIKFVEDLLTKSPLTSLGFSTGLSWIIGFIFGATGLTVMLGALLSTVVMWIIYRVLDVIKGDKVLFALAS
jgi:hypothetical protein